MSVLAVTLPSLGEVAFTLVFVGIQGALVAVIVAFVVRAVVRAELRRGRADREREPV